MWPARAQGSEGMRPSILDDPEHWRERAEEARRIANRLSDPASREAMLRIAADYERIAAQAQMRAVGGREKL
jgi:hypothetical protein